MQEDMADFQVERSLKIHFMKFLHLQNTQVCVPYFGNVLFLLQTCDSETKYFGNGFKKV